MFNLLKDDPFNIFGQAKSFAPGDGGATSGGSGGQGGGDQPPVNGSISDLKLDELNELPEETRKAVLSKISEKVKNVQSVTSKEKTQLKTQIDALESQKLNLGDWMKIKDVVEKDPVLYNRLNQTIEDHKAGRTVDAPKDLKTKLGVLDKWIDGAGDATTRDELREFKTYLEGLRSGDPLLQQKLDAADKRIASLESATRSVHTDRAVRGIEGLSNRFGSELVDKYRDKIVGMTAKYPQKADETFEDYMESLFLNVAGSSDRRSAFLKEAEIEKDKETKRKIGGLDAGGAGSGVVSGIEFKKDKAGRTDFRDVARQVLTKLNIKK